MGEQNDNRKREIDADKLIREYVESGEQPLLPMQDDNQADVEWYDQAGQDRPAPAEAVLTGGDVDAAWGQAAGGDEAVGGSSPTPDQDIVDEIGKALGITYAEGEPLHTTEKIARRDEKRWELNPASSEDYVERSQAPDVVKAPKAKQTSSKPRPSSAKRVNCESSPSVDRSPRRTP